MREIHVAMAILRNSSGQFLALVKDSAYTDQERYEENRLETPGGSIEEGEDAVEAARREVLEETGIEPEYLGPEKYPEEWSYVHERPEDERKIVFFPVPLKCEEEEVELSAEHSDYFWFAEQQFRERLPEHNVEGLKTVLYIF